MILFFSCCLFLVWIFRRYCGWIASTLLSIISRCDVSVGNVRWLQLYDVRIRLRSGLHLHIDNFTLQFFSQQFSKPIRICLGDVRIEAESFMLKRKKGENVPGNQSTSKRLLQLAQYCGLSVNCIHLVLLDAIPGCMVHISVDEVSAEAFRSREGWQMEISTRLTQGKVLRRKAASDGVVATFSLPFQLSLDMSPQSIKKIGLRIADPSLTFHEDIFPILQEWERSRKDFDITTSEEKETKISTPFWQKCEVSVSATDIAVAYSNSTFEIAKRKYLSLRISDVGVKTVNEGMQAKIMGIVLGDSFHRSDLKSAQLSLTIEDKENILDIGLSSDVVTAAISIPDLLWWQKHFTHILEKWTLQKKPKEALPKSTKTVNCTVEVDKFSCQLTDPNSGQSSISIDLLTFNKTDTEIEFGIESLVITDKKATIDTTTFDRHLWSEYVYVGVAIVQYSFANKNPQLLICIDDCKVEWSDELAEKLHHLLKLIRSTERTTTSPSSSSSLCIKLKTKRSAVVSLARNATFLLAISDEFDLEASLESKSVTGNKTKAKNGFSIDELRNAQRSNPPKDEDLGDISRKWSQIDRDKAKHEKRRIHEEKIAQKIKLMGDAKMICISMEKASPAVCDITITSNSPVYLCWSSLLHRTIYHMKSVIENTLKLPQSGTQPRRIPTILQLKALTNHSVEFELELPRYHRMSWKIPSLTFDRSSSGLSALAPNLAVIMNGHEIITAINVCITKRLCDTKMQSCRRAFGNLELITNKVWTWAADSFRFYLPYGFNFHQVFDEFINSFKWIKLVHNIKKKPFTKDFPLPADIRIVFKEVRLEMEDDPFENALQTSHELREDEVYECERRRQVLNERLTLAKKANPLISQAKLDELQASLVECNSNIFIQRWKKSAFTKRSLFVSKWTGWEIRAFADPSLHGTETCTELIHEFDPLSFFPSSGLEFSTLWARGVEFDMQEWVMTFKDYPIPYMSTRDMHFFGILVGAEQYEEGGRSLRESVIDLGEPWEQLTVLRNMSPLKFYYDMQCESAEWNCTYGPCWEPCLSTISLFWNNISALSRDPSPPLPFWDKMRFLLHGRFSWLSSSVVTTMLASLDPYNTTENIEMCWDEFGLDWSLGEIRIRTGLRVYVRTASRYDDSRILSLPDLKLRVALDWICGGDPHDHHGVILCAPHKLPHYSTTNHDSYGAFRSQHLDLSFSFDVSPGSAEGDKMPQILLYANTFRCFEFLMKTLTMKNRNIRRGKVFGTPSTMKPQLSKHFRNVQISVNLPKFLITYWMSNSMEVGFRVISDGLNLIASLRLSMAILSDAKLTRRRTYSWSPQHVSASLWGTEVHVYNSNNSPTNDDNGRENSLLLGISRLSYVRENSVARDCALHRLTAHDLKASWTTEIRDACLSIADGVHRAHLLRRVLSNDAIRILKLHEEDEGEPNPSTTKEFEDKTHKRGQSISDTNQSMLNQLIDEASTRLVAHCESTKELPIHSLLGVVQCTADDVAGILWQIDLLNSQLVLKGCDNDFILISAARASLTQKIHKCVWRSDVLLGKKSWSAVISGMQYFAPLGVTPDTPKTEFRWLDRELIEERAQDVPSDDISNFIAPSEAVGGVVESQLQRLQLQRIVSRCSCEIYFCYFNDDLKTDALEEIGVTKRDNDNLWGAAEPGVDCLTLKHNLLEACTSSKQYNMVVQIVNSLVLFLDPKKKESVERRQRWRLSFQLMDMTQMRESIVEQQSQLRDIVAVCRSLERQLFYMDSQENEESEKRQELLEEMNEYKERQILVSDELAICISCYKQRQVEATRKFVRKQEEDNTSAVARRFEVCFEDCTWKLTQADGQAAMAQTQIRNFLYTRTVRVDSSGDHLFEVGSIRITNLMPASLYSDTLHRDERDKSSQPAIRLLLRDMVPVGGICVKEHFEVNIAPMVVQLTYEFFEKMMMFFFPGKNIHKEDNLEAEDGGTPKFSFTRRIAGTLSMRSAKGTQGSGERKGSTANGKLMLKAPQDMDPDDIEKMRQRAHDNNFFVYIKIPEVPFIVSYKGKDDKNLIDVDRFSFLFPLCEFHDRNWTWLDVSLAVKQRCKRVLVQQFMKQKILRNRLLNVTKEGEDETLSEEDKKKIALGSVEDKKKKK